jgi:hypothetical protein
VVALWTMEDLEQGGGVGGSQDNLTALTCEPSSRVH